MKRPCILQINQSGAWKTVLPFDATDVPDEAFDCVDKFLRLMCSDHTTARVVMGKTGDTGKPVATHEVLKRWSRPEGWVNT